MNSHCLNCGRDCPEGEDFCCDECEKEFDIVGAQDEYTEDDGDEE